MVLNQLAVRLIPTPTAWHSAAVLLIALAASISLADRLYTWVENPCRRWVKRRLDEAG
jgi:peptidoglycan/LPS O-acetylase OafA/YrhL